jgi:nucleoside-diphosphate-sugar epimerase
LKQFTLFGANGFVATHLARHLQSAGHGVSGITRSNPPPPGMGLGHVIYAVGMTADFRSRPFETVAAHVSHLADVLEKYEFESFLYLSSTRVYRGSEATREDAAIRIVPADPESLYDATKLAGETLCMALGRPGIRVARLSNLYGPGNHTDNFLSQVLIEALRQRRVTIRSGRNSEKDYLHVDDACAALMYIAVAGRARIFNVAAGCNVSHEEIAELVSRHTGAEVRFAPDGPENKFPPIDTGVISSEIPWRPRALKDTFPELVQEIAAQHVS